MSRSTEALQGSASGVVSGGPPRETASHVYNMERFQRDGTPSPVARLAGGATPRDHEDRLRGHMSLIGAVDDVLGTQPAHSSASAASNSAAGYGQHRA